MLKKNGNVGDAIKFQDPQISFRNDSLEINVSRSTSILEPDESEIDDLPTYDELKESIYVPKTIEALEVDAGFDNRYSPQEGKNYKQNHLMTDLQYFHS